jgi:hypothetical protein
LARGQKNLAKVASPSTDRGKSSGQKGSGKKTGKTAVKGGGSVKKKQYEDPELEEIEVDVFAVVREKLPRERRKRFVLEILRELRKQHHMQLLVFFKETEDFFRVNKQKFELARAKMKLGSSEPIDPYAGLEKPRRPVFKLLPSPEIMDEIIKQANKQWVLSVLEQKNPTNQPLPSVDIVSLLQGQKPSISEYELSIAPASSVVGGPAGSGLISPPVFKNTDLSAPDDDSAKKQSRYLRDRKEQE